MKISLTMISMLLSFGLQAATLVVNSTSDLPDANIGDGVCSTGNSTRGVDECSLRAAVQEGNVAINTNINFDIPNCPGGICVIERDTTANGFFPDLVKRFVIDGSSQPGNADVCAQPIKDRPAYAVVMAGDGQIVNAGFRLQEGSDGSVIKGLNIRNFYDNIIIQKSNDNNIICNFIGTDETGMSATDSNNGNGLLFLCDSMFNIVGGIQASDGNLIAGHMGDGIQVYAGFDCAPAGTVPSTNTFLGNYIGVNKTATATLNNSFSGISFFGDNIGADNNYVGVSPAGDFFNPNVIGGNESGVYIDSGTSGIVVQGNYIGTDEGENNNLANVFGGVDIISGFSNTIGGVEPQQANVIANNSEGVFVSGGTDSVSNAIRGNSFYGHSTLPIDLIVDGGVDPDGLNVNDPGDLDQGANALMNRPEVLAYTMSTVMPTLRAGGPETQVDFSFQVDTVDTEAEFPLLIDVYFSSLMDAPLDLFYVTTLTYNTAQTVENAVVVLPFGMANGFLLLTATDGEGNTSEMAAVNLDLIFTDGFD